MLSIPSYNSQMHNDIMAAGSRERSPMVAPENKKLINAEAKAIHMILNGIGDAIYSTVDACATTREMWLVLNAYNKERLSTNKMSRQSCFRNLISSLQRMGN
ncbi:hypothetical protein Tco_0279349 [Tanacetum coccineum]